MMEGGIAMMLFGVLMMAGLVLLAVVLVRVIGGGLSSSTPSTSASERERPAVDKSARQALDERYARGEVSTEQYQERLRVLGWEE